MKISKPHCLFLSFSLLAALALVGCVDDEGRMNFKFVSSGQALEDAAAFSQTLNGVSLKPLAPVNLTGFRTPANDLVIEWTRRSRLGAGLRPSTPVPLAEEVEVYEIEAYDGSTLLRTWRVYGDQAQPIIWLVDPSTSGGYSLNANGGWNSTAAAGIVSLVSAQQIRGNCKIEWTIDFSGSLLPDWLRLNATTPAAGTGFWEWSRISNQMQASLSPAPTTVAAGSRLMIDYSGDQVRYYLDYTGPTSVPIFISPTPPSVFPLHAASGTLNFFGDVITVRSSMIQMQTPDGIYTAAQQTADGLTPGNPIKIRVYQVSQIVGRGAYVEGTL